MIYTMRHMCVGRRGEKHTNFLIPETSSCDANFKTKHWSLRFASTTRCQKNTDYRNLYKCTQSYLQRIIITSLLLTPFTSAADAVGLFTLPFSTPRIRPYWLFRNRRESNLTKKKFIKSTQNVYTTHTKRALDREREEQFTGARVCTCQLRTTLASSGICGFVLWAFM